MVPEELDEEDPVAVRLMDRGPGGVRLQLSGRRPELVDPPPNLVVLVSDDVDEGAVPSDRLPERPKERFVLRREDRRESVLQAADPLLEQALVLLPHAPG